MNRQRNTGCECSRELVDAVARQLATRTARDSDFPVASDLSVNDFFAIVQNGINKKASVSSLESAVRSGIVKYNTTAYWNAAKGYVPTNGTIIIYSDYGTLNVDGESVDVPGIKIGSGNGYVQDLAFVGAVEANMLLEHISDSTIHTSAVEKAFWNNKLNVDDSEEIIDETLIFNRN